MTSAIPPHLGRSWWLRDALAADPGEPAPPLSGDTTADVVVVGGGYTGMWTAHALKERQPGLDVVVLEQDICGGGPSGRNGGFVNGWWESVGELADLFGPDGAVELAAASERSVDAIEAFCSAHAVDAWFVRPGDMGVATSPSQEGRGRETVEDVRRLGAPDKIVELTAEQVQERCSSPVFGGGILQTTAANCQPARLARGLRRVLLERGVRIHESTPVTRFHPGPPAQAETPGGVVRAGSAVLAVNAWAEQWHQFRSRITVRGSYIVLTAPAPERLEELGWTGREAIYNFRDSLNYLRTTPDGRVAFGTGGLQPGFARRIGPRLDYEEKFIAKVAQQLWRMFPSLRDVPLEAAWGGPVDVSGSHLPYFGTLRSGNVHHGFGYTGNGVAPSHLGGQILASLTLGSDDEYSTLPIAGHRPKRFPPEPIRSPGLLVANHAIARKDEAEDAGGRAGPITEFFARLPRRLGYHLGP
jgi:glycine/D-amino acid oxidase-like deaminating enzyme